jgi:peptidoglycan/LPS O-acetylase OafA/YrhL
MHIPNLGTILDSHYWQRLGLFILISPHIANAMYLPAPPFGGPLWSVGSEEYFYLSWPILLKTFFRKHLPLLFTLIILGMPLLRMWTKDPFYSTVLDFLRPDCMVIGGLFAWLYLNHRKWVDTLFRYDLIQGIVYLFALRHLVYGATYGPLTHTFFSLVYAFIILSIAFNPRSFLTLERNWLKFMGKISYGFYVFHWAVNVLCIKLLLHFGGIKNFTVQNWVLFLGAFAVNTALSAASYYILERRFLNLKQGRQSND